MEYLKKDPAEIDRLFSLLRTNPPTARPGFYTMMTGTRIRMEFTHHSFASWDGTVLPLPDWGGSGYWEYAYLVKTVLDSTSRYNMISIGAGNGEWAIASVQVHAKLKAGAPRFAISVEGDKGHFDYMLQSFADNEISPVNSLLIHGVAAPQDGYAYFPVCHDPKNDWGASIAALASDPNELDRNIDYPDHAVQGRVAASGGRELEYQTVTAYSLATLMQNLDHVDFIHSDIQGAEGGVFPAAMDVLTRKVGVCLVETHGGAIEEELNKAFTSAGWHLDLFDPCGETEDGAGARMCVRDGTQVWVNPRFHDLSGT